MEAEIVEPPSAVGKGGNSCPAKEDDGFGSSIPPAVLESPNQKIRSVVSDSATFHEHVEDQTAQHLPGMLSSPMPNRQECGATALLRMDPIRTPIRSAVKPVPSNPATPSLIGGSVPGTPGTPDIGSAKKQCDTPKSADKSELGDQVHPLPFNMSRFSRLLPRSGDLDDEIHPVSETIARAELQHSNHLKARSGSIRSVGLTERSEASTLDLPFGLARSNTERSARSVSDTLSQVSRANTDKSLLVRSSTDHSLSRSNTDRTGLTVSGSMVRSNTEQSLAPSQRDAKGDACELPQHSPRQWLGQGDPFSLPDKLNDSALSTDGAYKSSEERLAVMVKLCRRAALVPSGVLDKRLQDMTVAVGKTGATGAFFTSRPVSAALAKWPWRLFLVLLGCGTAALTVSHLPDLDRTRTAGPYFAFVPLLLRNGTALHPRDTPAQGIAGCVTDLQLLSNGCAVPGGESWWDGDRLLLRYTAPVDFNGFQYTTSSASPALDPVLFEIWESAASADGPWSVASFSECPRAPTEQRGAVVREDWRAGWRARWMVTVLSYALATVLFLSGSVLAVVNECAAARVALGVALLLVCAGYIASLARTPLSVCARDDATYAWAAALSASIALWLVLVTTILRESHHNLKVLMCFGAALSATKLLEVGESLRDDSVWSKHWAARPPLTLYLFVGAGVSFFFFPALVMACHWRVQRKASQLMQPDREEYDRCWQDIVGMEMNRRLLAAIADTAERLSGPNSHKADKTVRQMCRTAGDGEAEPEWDIFCNPNSAHAGWFLSGRGPGDASPSVHALPALDRSVLQRSSWLSSRKKRAPQPVSSLDQLYVQAALMHPVLKSKVSRWAALSAGLFPIKGGSPRRSVSGHGSPDASVAHDGGPHTPKHESCMGHLESPLGPPGGQLASPGQLAREGRDDEAGGGMEGRRLLWDEAEGDGRQDDAGEIFAGSRWMDDDGAGVFSSSVSAGFQSALSGAFGSVRSHGGSSSDAKSGGVHSAVAGAAAGGWIRPDLERARSMTVHKTLDRPPSESRLDTEASAREFASLPCSAHNMETLLASNERQGTLKASMHFAAASAQAPAEEREGRRSAQVDCLANPSVRREAGAIAAARGLLAASAEEVKSQSAAPDSELCKDLELEAALRGGAASDSAESVWTFGGAFGDPSAMVGSDSEDNQQLSLSAANCSNAEDARAVAGGIVDELLEAAVSGNEAKRDASPKVSVHDGVEPSCSLVGRAFGQEAQTVQGDESMVKWSDLKSPDRAVEKAVRTYKGDVSQLVDVCRQCIVFENLADLLSCLEVIEQDGEVLVERIKNRLSTDYDSKLSAGYRDVALNLRVVNPETLGIGIETHVTEVQLILLPFYELKTNEGHKRYVAFRNLRAE